jgi:hypothetical protein
MKKPGHRICNFFPETIILYIIYEGDCKRQPEKRTMWQRIDEALHLINWQLLGYVSFFPAALIDKIRTGSVDRNNISNINVKGDIHRK